MPRRSGRPHTTPRRTFPSPSWEYEDWTVGTRREREALEFADAATGVEATRAFVERTNLDSETVLVHQYRVDRCRTRTLERLRWTPVDEPVAGGVDLVLEYDERKETCERGGAKASEATVVRLPGGFERVVSFGYRY